MRSSPTWIIVLALAAGFTRPTPSPTSARGALVVVGGGRTTEPIVQATLELLPPGAHVVVLPQASQLEDRGQSSAAMWRAAGVGQARVLTDLGADDARRQLARADLIWMPGGSQERLLDALREAELVGLLAERHEAGAVLGGTSAGAAVQSAWMLTGEADLESVRAGATELVPGLGLWPGVIVDQHFVARRRQARLLAAVLDHPDHVGVGVDESTAVVVEGSALRVVGAGSVVVYDARKADVKGVARGELHAARGVTLQLLTAGDELSLEP